METSASSKNGFQSIRARCKKGTPTWERKLAAGIGALGLQAVGMFGGGELTWDVGWSHNQRRKSEASRRETTNRNSLLNTKAIDIYTQIRFSGSCYFAPESRLA